MMVIACCCVKQRSKGRKARAIADAEFEKNASELQAYRSRMQHGGFAMEGGPHPPGQVYMGHR